MIWEIVPSENRCFKMALCGEYRINRIKRSYDTYYQDNKLGTFATYTRAKKACVEHSQGILSTPS